MKSIVYVVCLVMAFVASGCFEIKEDLYLKADGTGDYKMTIDMSGMFSDPFMGEMMTKGMKEEMKVDALEIDSLISFSEMNGGKLPPTLTDTDRAMIGKTEMRMIMSETSQTGKFVITFPFDNMEELNQFQAAFQRMQDGQEEAGAGGMSGMLGGGSGFMSSNSIWSLSGKTLKRQVENTDAALSMMEELDEETMGMMKMMMEGASFTSTYHLPGKVKKCSIPNATVDGKTVSLSYELLDALDEIPETGGEIKFKKN